ncbi:MAG: chloride channel protein [Limosilactobacillus pontis]
MPIGTAAGDDDIFLSCGSAAPCLLTDQQFLGNLHANFRPWQRSGAIAGITMIHAGIIPASCYLNIIAISMAAFFGAAEGAPFSAILLVTEMVGSIQQIFPMMMLTFIAYYVSMLLGARPSIYNALRQQMVFKN